MTLHPIVERYLANQLPEPMVAALLGGSLPVPPADFIQAQAHAVLAATPFAERALQGFQAMPESVVQGLLMDRIQPPAPLELVLRFRREFPVLEAALLHPDLTADIVEHAIPDLPGPALEIIANNQALWLQRPTILDQLEQHPAAEYNLKRRINEFRFEVLRLVPEEVKQERLEILDEVEAGRLDKAWAELPLPKEETVDEKAAEIPDVPHGTPEEIVQAIKAFEGEEVNLSVAKRIARLRTNQKIMLAIKGGKEERTILIREANRLIQENVIRNGRITEGEVAFIANMRTIHEGVLRIISMNREWMKKYTIVKALVYNPRTPLPVAMSNLKRLNEFDMKLMQRDKNIPEVLRREAKRYLESKKDGKG
ncbi:MAG TPA: hypothetical protein VFT46_01500 [Holophagaceae bacterium]|nr:hypothetical protein [Holophagaceae bacterium]